jgi:hypothetical protein
VCGAGLLIRPSVGMRYGVGALEVREWKIFDKIATWFFRVGLNVMNAPATRSGQAKICLCLCQQAVPGMYGTCLNRAAKAGAKQKKNDEC